MLVEFISILTEQIFCTYGVYTQHYLSVHDPKVVTYFP